MNNGLDWIGLNQSRREYLAVRATPSTHNGKPMETKVSAINRRLANTTKGKSRVQPFDALRHRLRGGKF